MPRQGGFGGGRSSSPPPRSTAAPARPPVNHAPPVQQAPTQGGSMFGGIGSTIMTGMAFGAGSEIAHQAVRSVIGGGNSHSSAPVEQPQQQQQQQQTQPQYCGDEMLGFSNCLKSTNDISLCQSYMDMLKQCQKQYKLI